MHWDDAIWEQLDSANRENGYSSNFADGANLWLQADSLLLSAFWLFFLLYLFVCCFFMIFPVFIGLAFFVVFVLWLIALFDVRGSSQVDPVRRIDT